MSILERIRVWKVATAAKWRQLLTDSGVELNPYQRPHQETTLSAATFREGFDPKGSVLLLKETEQAAIDNAGWKQIAHVHGEDCTKKIAELAEYNREMDANFQAMK